MKKISEKTSKRLIYSSIAIDAMSELNLQRISGVIEAKNPSKEHFKEIRKRLVSEKINGNDRFFRVTPEGVVYAFSKSDTFLVLDIFKI